MTEPSQNSRLLTASFHISSRPVAPLVHVPMSCETAIVGSWHVHITHVLLGSQDKERGSPRGATLALKCENVEL